MFTFDSIISEKTSPITGNGQTTNLGKLADFISKREFAGSVIFTDGISTEGIEPILTFNNLDTPIYTVGIGNKNSLIDGIPFKAICSINEYMDEKDLSLKTMERIYGRKL